MSDFFILDGHTPVPATLHEWASWFEKDDRHVARTRVEPGFLVSTVFLGLDHSFGFGGPPLLFETMVFGDYGEAERFPMLRYATWDEAEAGHAETVAIVQQFTQAKLPQEGNK